ncbi:PKD domain-containing protein [Halorientalis brevis]|uniref:PKD domain-containing protein n=1 Tax=Halorientalis brevis TaxID=1126241 RepID=A0ABD6C8B3_9EURY|nr:PKD domain-containing protein [Halorientalis brevis]
MSGTRHRVRSLALVVLVVGSLVAMAGPVSASSSATAQATALQHDGNGSHETFAVRQGDQCYEVTPLGDGTETVDDYFNYQGRETDYSSINTTAVQENQESSLFIYHGTNDRYSLGLVHDEHGVAPYGSTITMNFSGLPSGGDWVVQDDYYGENTDDDWNTGGTTAHVDWKWKRDRTDGGAFRGLTTTDDLQLTIDPEFNEEANHWGDWNWSGGQNRTEAWRLYTADGENRTLQMDQDVTITRGPCGGTAPTASLSASPSNPAVNESVSFDASGSSDDASITEYAWDFDGDGSTDRTTQDSNVEYTYGAAGEYTAEVTVTDADGNTDTATASVSVTEDVSEPPSASLTASPSNAAPGQSVSFNASGSQDDEGITEYAWDFDDDGTIDETTQSSTVTHAYETAGDYTATVTVTDADGQTATASAAVTVTNESDENDPPTASLTASPSDAAVNEAVSFDAGGSEDDSGIDTYAWDFDGDGYVDDRTNDPTVTHAYEAAGEYTAEVTVTDADGQTDAATATVSVTGESDGGNGSDGADTEPPTATIVVPDPVVVDESITVRATNISDESEIEHVCWYVDGVEGPDGRSFEETFTTTGTHSVTLDIRDSAGNANELTKTFQVVAKDGNDGDDGNDGNDGNDGDDGDDGNDGNDGDDGNDGSDDSDGSDVNYGDSDGGPMAGITQSSVNFYEETETRPTPLLVQMNTTSVTTGDPVSATVWLSDTDELPDGYSLNLTVVRTGEDGVNATVVNETEIPVASGQGSVTSSALVFEDPGQYRALIGNQSKSFVVRDDEVITSPDPGEDSSDSDSDGQTTTAQTSPEPTPSEPADDDGASANTATVTEASTTSSDGPGFGVLGGLVALVLSVAALTRQR